VPGEDVVAVDHERELGVEVLPVVCVLPAGFIDGDERIAFRYSEVMRDCAFLLALVSYRLTGLIRLPDP